MENKKIVFALFDGLNGSVRKAINNLPNKEEYEVIGFDIREETKDGMKNVIFDLGKGYTTGDFTDMMNYIYKKYGAPYAIVASPMCMSFSRASAMKGGSTGWVFMEEDDGLVHPYWKPIKYRPKADFEDPDINMLKDKSRWRYKYKESRENAIKGGNAINNTINMIKWFTPKYWYIENPSGSLMWNYIKYNLGHENYLPTANASYGVNYKCNYNLVHYGAYDAPTKKPTIFLSNLEMDLKKVEKGYKSKIKWTETKREDRSDIPLSLLEEIFTKFKKDEENS